MLPSPSEPLTLPYTHTHTVSRYNILYTHRHYTHKRTHALCTHITIYLPIHCVYLPSPFTTLPPHFSPSFTCPFSLAPSPTFHPQSLHFPHSLSHLILLHLPSPTFLPFTSLLHPPFSSQSPLSQSLNPTAFIPFTILFPSSLLPFFPSTLSTCAPSMEEIQCILDGV